MKIFGKKREKRITWIKPYTKIKDVKYSKEDVKIKWFYDGSLNASVNCIDRHLKKNGNKTAIIWVGDDPADSKKYLTKNYTKMFVKQQTFLKALAYKRRQSYNLSYDDPRVSLHYVGVR